MQSYRPMSRDEGDGRLSEAQIRRLLAEPDDARSLRLLEDGDPIGLAKRVHEWLVHWAFVLDEDDMILYSRARVSIDRHDLEPDQSLDDWIDDRVSRTAGALMARDEQLVVEGVQLEQPVEPRFSEMAAALGLKLELARKACVVVNGLSEDVRHAFFNLVYLRRNLREYAKERGLDAPRTSTLLRRALLAVSLMNDEEHDPLREDSDR